jgi:hypothetical protein
MVVNRLTRLSPLDQSSWFTMTFESDNTLREPPMRVLPGRCLQDLESRSKEGTADGAIYHVSGEIHHYRGEEYLLVRSAIPKRNMGQF